MRKAEQRSPTSKLFQALIALSIQWPWILLLGALQGLELCLAPMPLSQLVLREGKAELGRLRRIYAFAGWRRDCLRYCQVLYESIVQPVPIHADSLTVLYFEDVQTICNTESGRTNGFFIFFTWMSFTEFLEMSNLEPAIHCPVSLRVTQFPGTFGNMIVRYCKAYCKDL